MKKQKVIQGRTNWGDPTFSTPKPYPGIHIIKSTIGKLTYWNITITGEPDAQKTADAAKGFLSRNNLSADCTISIEANNVTVNVPLDFPFRDFLEHMKNERIWNEYQCSFISGVVEGDFNQIKEENIIPFPMRTYGEPTEKGKALERIENYVSKRVLEKLAELMPEKVYVRGPPAGDYILPAERIEIRGEKDRARELPVTKRELLALIQDENEAKKIGFYLLLQSEGDSGVLYLITKGKGIREVLCNPYHSLEDDENVLKALEIFK
ncbi:MAG: hypothetical protein QXG98_04750 [Candidatus Micrarchaeia archaeon]